MGTLAAALQWAQRGLPVFPLKEHTKEPAFVDWVNTATTDETVIRALWTDPVLKTEKNYNIGCLCSDMVVVDIDVKDGKNGHEEYAAFGGEYDTLVVQTPTGGFHCYFYGPDSSNSPISNSIDIRSRNAFVVAPGSILPEYGTGAYTVVNDAPMKWIKPEIERLLTPAYSRSELPPTDFTVDADANVQAGINFLESAPVAVEGQRGDETTFTTAARLVREMGLSPQIAFCLMRDHWNERCQPPWDVYDLMAKVENAAAYGTAADGVLTPEALFGGINFLLTQPPSLMVQTGADWGNAVELKDIPPRPWLVSRMLMRRNITLLMAAGSAGKSSVALALAAHLTQGLPFAGNEAHTACKTIVYNGEDDLDEQSRRLYATCASYGFDYNFVRQNVMLLSPKEFKMDLVAKDGYTVQENEVIVNQLIEKAKGDDVGLVVLDPLVKIHKCDESDNVQMDYVMETITRIAQEANVAVLALHHTSKGGGKQENRVGNMDIGRGASAIINAARIGYTLLSPSDEDAENYGFKDDEKHMWVRLDDAKMNMALANDNATWFRKDGVTLPNNDTVGVLMHEDIEKSHIHIQDRIAAELCKALQVQGGGSMPIGKAVSIIKTEIPSWTIKTDTFIKQRLEGLFHMGYTYGESTLKLTREVTGDKGKEKEHLLITLL